MCGYCKEQHEVCHKTSIIFKSSKKEKMIYGGHMPSSEVTIYYT